MSYFTSLVWETEPTVQFARNLASRGSIAERGQRPTDDCFTDVATEDALTFEILDEVLVYDLHQEVRWGFLLAQF